jgi:hypothetical protein
VGRAPIRHVFELNRTNLNITTSTFAGNWTVGNLAADLDPRGGDPGLLREGGDPGLQREGGDPCIVNNYKASTTNRTFGVRGKVAMKRMRDRSLQLQVTRSRPISNMTFNLTAITRGLKS